MINILSREFVYIWYYFTLQWNQIFEYWVIGMVLGSAISVFSKDSIHRQLTKLQTPRLGIFGLILASLLGIASPLCMYGTIPLAASLYQMGLKEDLLASFMMSSILLNPQLMIYSLALGQTAWLIRLASALFCGVIAGLCVRWFFKGRTFFHFDGLAAPVNRDTDPNPLWRFLKNIGRNIRATGPYFLLGILLSALFQRYVPSRLMTDLFGGNEALGVLMAATIGVPLYACGGGTIPLLQQWLYDGMSIGSAAAFMLTGPSTKITNLGALKIVLGLKHFCLYLAYVMLFSLATGILVNLFV